MSFYKRLVAVLSLFFVCAPAFADGYVEEGPSPIRNVPAQSSARASRVGGPSILQAQGEQLSRAIAHYARARALLISAIEEFDRGYKVAKPDVVLDSKGFRKGLVERAEDLEQLIAPQARISKTGVKLEGDNRLLRTEAK